MSLDYLPPAARSPTLPSGDRLLTLDELAKEFRISTKTVCRWRQDGLVSRRFMRDGRQRVGILQSSVDIFLAHHEDCFRRGIEPRRRTDQHRDNDLKVARIMDLPLKYIDNEQFARLGSEKQREKETLKPLHESDPPAKKPRLPDSLPVYLADLYESPLLTREEEVHLFRKMNYLKYKANMLREQLDPSRPARRLIRQIEKLYGDSVAAKMQIIRANLRLVVSIAKRYVTSTREFFEVVSDGNMSLLKAVDNFDFSLGNKFSTYASWTLMKNFARSRQDFNRQRDRFRTGHEELFTCTEDKHADPREQEAAQMQREAQVKGILRRLDGRERQIITARFGLTLGVAPRTLAQVGVAMGVTKERVRQLQARAMRKMRGGAEESPIDRTVQKASRSHLL
jgi:RNA polymerase primary sigma factor